MPVGYKTIPRAAPRIYAALAKLGYTPIDPNYTAASAIKHRSRYFMTPVSGKRGPAVWFKASLQSSPHLKSALREEIRIQKMFAHYEKLADPSFLSPSYIAHHDNGRDFLWLIRKYWDGTFAGDMSKHFGFSPIFFRVVRPALMAKIITDIGRMTSFAKSRGRLETHDLGWYLMDFEYYQREFFQPMLRKIPAPGWDAQRLNSVKYFFTSQQKFLQKNAAHFTHGDMYPTNIMLRPGLRKPVVVFDWELGHLNLSTFDASLVYLLAWRKPAWQKSFKELVLAAKPASVATQSWDITTMSLAIRLAGFCFIRLHNFQPNRYPLVTAKEKPVLKKMYRYYLSVIQKILDK